MVFIFLLEPVLCINKLLTLPECLKGVDTLDGHQKKHKMGYEM